MEWIAGEPRQNGYFWYIDTDFREPQLAVVTGVGEGCAIVVEVDGFDHEFDDIKEDGPHFYGPIDMTPPAVTPELDAELQRIDESRRVAWNNALEDALGG